MRPSRAGHDIVVIGASAGGVEATRSIAAGLPADLPAAVFMVVHIGEGSRLATIIDRAGPLRACQPAGGEPIECGRIYVAGPGAHLLLHDGHMLVRRGPRENRSRPAIDALFRSAAASHGGRVVGAVLTGSLDDGASGLRAVQRCGGLAVVQDPADALFPEMPISALRVLAPDHVVRVADLPALLARLVVEPAAPTPAIPVDIRLETAIAAQELADPAIDDALGVTSRFTCPDCQGALWEIEDGDMLRYRCHVGHAFTADAVLSARDEEIERLLGGLLRSHQQRAAFARRMVERERRRDHSRLVEQLEARARDYEDDAELVRRLFPSLDAGRVMTSAEGPERSQRTDDKQEA